MTRPACTFALCAVLMAEARPTAASLDWAANCGRPTTFGTVTKTGGTALLTVTSTAAHGPMFPARSRAIALSRCRPLAERAVFHETVTGEAAPAAPRLTPSS